MADARLAYDGAMSRSTPSSLPVATLALVAASLVSIASSAAPALRAEDGRFVDAAGRTIVLRGVNVAGNSKVPPFTGASDPQLFEGLRELGMNVVRLLFTWEAYEPVKGTYDAGYLAYYRAAVEKAHDSGLNVIVDLHQDGFSRASIGGCGDGFPLWALPAGVTPAAPDNGSACKSWGIKMQSDKDMMAAWSAFYSDAEGVRTGYLAMLGSVATELSSEPAVIGYDLLNEPWGDEVTEIGPLYEEAAAVVRKASPDAILFVSPHARTSAGSPTELPKPSFGNLAYSPHFYDASVILFKSWSGVEPDAAFQLMNDTAAAWGAPLFLGEFGAPATTQEANPYMRTLFRHLDDHLSSGAQWVHTPGWTEIAKDGWNDEDFSIVAGGGPRDNFLVRCAPRAIAGLPTSFHVEPSDTAEASTATLLWDNDPAAGKTEVYAPLDAFGGTRTIEGTGEGLSCGAEGFLVTCESASAGPMRLVLRAVSAGGGGGGGAGGGGGGAGTGSSGCGCHVACGAPLDRGSLAGGLLVVFLLSGVRRRSPRRRGDPR